LRKQIGKHQANVFSFRGKPVHQVNTKTWHRALKRVGIENFRWHDLRHSWASWHIQEGTSLHVLQKLGGWSSPEMVQKYAHLSSEHLAHWADRRPAVQPEIAPESGTFLTTGKENRAGFL
jgi:integrase